MSSDKYFYVYAFLRMDKPGEFIYGDLVFGYEPFYIGKGINDRITSSLRYESGNNNLKRNIINKIHKNDMEVKSIKIKEGLSESEAFLYEKEVIGCIGKRIDGVGPLSNLSDGGRGYSDVPVLQYDLNGDFVKEYTSVGVAVSETGVLNVSPCCRGVRKTAGKFIWRYKTNEDYDYRIPVDFIDDMMHFGNYERSVIQMDMDGKFINGYKSIKEAAERTGTSNGKIVSVCKGHRKQSNGFKWKYKK